MKLYKHYSFDLWKTIIKSNPEFKVERSKYFFEHFNTNKMSLEAIDKIIRDTDVMCDTVNSIIGSNIDAYEIYTIVLYKLGYDITILSHRDIQSLYHLMEQMFIRYHPTCYDDNTVFVLNKLKRTGATMSILSNTGFMKGSTMKKILHKLDLSYLFDFQLYSDEMELSKPNSTAFMTMVNNAYHLRRHNPITLVDILHIGDNPIADIKGAQLVHLDAFLINDGNKTIKDLLSI